MAQKCNLIFSSNLNLLISFYFIISYIPLIQSLSFKYPTAITLKDGKIFVIHSLGIDICDSNYQTSERKLTFANEINSDESLSKISLSKYSSGEFLIFIINKFYLYDEYGQKILEYEIQKSCNAEYFSLTVHKIIQNNGYKYYYFLFGFMDISSIIYFKLYLYYCSFDTFSNSFVTQSSLSFTNGYFGDYIISWNGLSFEFVAYNSIDYVLIFIQSTNFVVSYLTITNNKLAFSNNYNSFRLQNIEFSQSVSKSLNSKLFFCGLTNKGKALCLIHDLDDFLNRNNKLYYDGQFDKICKKYPYNIKTYYFPETEEYVFSCLTVDNEIQTTIYNKDMEKMEDIGYPSKRLQKTFPDCDDFYYSIIYSQIKQQYIIISDYSCDNNQQYIPLEEIVIENEEEEEEKINNKEEEKLEEKEEEKEEEKSEDLPEKEKEEDEKIIESTETSKENEIKEETVEIEVNIEEKLKEENTEEEKEEKEEIIEEEKVVYICPLEKCKECDEESEKLNLCKKCNIEMEYYPLNVGNNINENKYYDCYNETTKPPSSYLDKAYNVYKLCYSSCKTCDYGGNGNENNCTSCQNNQILKPDIPNSSNCVSKCPYFYYYIGENYKCTKNVICPDNFQIEILEKGKCIDKCINDNTHKIQYDGECYNEPPEGTIFDEKRQIYIDSDVDKCRAKEKILRLLSNDNITEHEIDMKARLYAKEFDYTDEHVTIYKNNYYSITLYKDGDCSSELGLNIDEFDFGECYTKIQQEKDISGNLVIVVISKIINSISITIDKYIFNPYSGEKIDFIEICVNDTLNVKKNLKEQLKYNGNIGSLEELTEQGIDIFNPNSEFYTDLCFHFKSPINGMDIPIKDRLKLFFPNITLCDEGCTIKGINLTSWKAMCECAFSNLIHGNIFGNNLLVQKSFGEFRDIFTKTNIEVLKCYKDIFNIEMYKQNIGMFIIASLIVVHIAMIFVYYLKYKIRIKKYVLSISDVFLSSVLEKKDNNLIVISPKKNDLLKCSPPKEEKKNLRNEKNGKKSKSKTTIRRKKSSSKKLKIMDYLKRDSKVYILSKDFKQNSNDNIIMSDEMKENQNIDKIFEPITKGFKNKNNININEYLKTDLNDMDYDQAIKEDKRKFCKFFFEKIKTEQILLNTFFKNEVLKPTPVKIILLILNFDLYLIINGLFFNESYISDLLNSSSDANKLLSFINRIIDRIAIITLTGVIINYIVEFFFVEEKKIKRILRIEKDNVVVLKYEIVQIIKNSYNRYNIFIILSSIIMIFSLYYIFCFNNVYPCIKGEWLKSSLIIICIMQILPLFLCFLETVIRFISFKCKSERLFRLSMFFSN